MISYLSTFDNYVAPVLILSKDTPNQKFLYPTTKNRLTQLLQTCKRDRLYLQIPVAFDTETTNFEQDNMKLATMYIWQFALKFECETIFVYGRTWSEWEQFMSYLRYNCGKKKMVIYVHNLSFEFHFFYTHIYLTKVFARKKRHPIYAESDKIIFKCSYILTNYSLRGLAKSRGYTEKETMNYDLMRHSLTVMSKEDLSYSRYEARHQKDNDVRKLDVAKLPNSFIAKMMSRLNTIKGFKRARGNCITGVRIYRDSTSPKGNKLEAYVDFDYDGKKATLKLK